MLNEDPVVKASLKKWKRDQLINGYEPVDYSQTDPKKLKQAIFGSYPHVFLKSYPLRFNETRTISREVFQTFLEERKPFIYRKGANYYIYDSTSSLDSFGFNNAAATINPEILAYIYREEGESPDKALAELKDSATSFERLNELANLGLSRFPTLLDPKYNADLEAGIIKPETNLWQFIITLWKIKQEMPDIELPKIKPLRVVSFTDVITELREAIKDGNLETAEELAKNISFLPSKKWGPENAPETYAYNLPIIQLLIQLRGKGVLIDEKEIATLSDQIKNPEQTASIHEALNSRIAKAIFKFISNLRNGQIRSNLSKTKTLTGNREVASAI